MDNWKRIKQKLSGINLHQVGTRPVVDPGQDSSTSGEDTQSRPGYDMGKIDQVTDELHKITDQIQGINPQVVSNVLSLLKDIEQIHSKNIATGHMLADRVLLQVINNDQITKAFKRCC